MQRSFKKYTRILFVAGLAVIFLSDVAFGYWIWTPETKKFVNPKYAVKDSPKEQFDWALSFYDAKDYQRSAAEFEKLVKHYEYSEYASRAQYYTGLSCENMGKLYIAYQNYQKAVDNFPHIENLDEIIAREYNIANFYATKDSPKVLGMGIMMALDRAIEIYRKVVDNAPYGKLADEAQYKMGEALKKAERYDEAILAFQKLTDEYPDSAFFDKAKYELAYCAYKASLKPAYDIEPTDKAIKAFQDFAETNQDKTLSKEAEKTIRRLKDKAAEKSMITARFYESQKHYKSAVIYYKDVLTNFPGSSSAGEAKSKIEKLSAIIEKREARDSGSGDVAGGWKVFNFLKKPESGPKPKETPVSAESVAIKSDVEKDKVEEVKSKKKGWALFGFGKPAKKKETAKKEKPAQAAKSSGWNPFSFMGKSKSKETSAQTKSQEQKKGWSPFSFGGSSKKTASRDADKAPKASGMKMWNPFSPTGKSKSKEVSKKTTSQEPKKGWVPFGLGKPAKKKEAAKKEKPAQTKSQEQKKGWSPFSFGGSSKKTASRDADKAPKASGMKMWNPFSPTGRFKPKEESVQATESNGIEENKKEEAADQTGTTQLETESTVVGKESAGINQLPGTNTGVVVPILKIQPGPANEPSVTREVPMDKTDEVKEQEVMQ